MTEKSHIGTMVIGIKHAEIVVIKVNIVDIIHIRLNPDKTEVISLTKEWSPCLLFDTSYVEIVTT